MRGRHANTTAITTVTINILSYMHACIDLIPYGTGLETNHVLPLRAVQIAMTLCALQSTFGIYHIFGGQERSGEQERLQFSSVPGRIKVRMMYVGGKLPYLCYWVSVQYVVIWILAL